MDYLVVLLGGRVTEHLIFGQITTGASDDLRKVHEISRSMVTDYGMGSKIQSKQLPATDYSMSDATRRLIDEEQQFIADQAHRRALSMVSEHRDLLEGLAARLLDNEVLERADIDEARGRARGRAGLARRVWSRCNGGSERRVAASEPYRPR